MEKFKYLDEKTIELAGNAASIADECRPCSKTPVTSEKVNEIVEHIKNLA